MFLHRKLAEVQNQVGGLHNEVAQLHSVVTNLESQVISLNFEKTDLEDANVKQQFDIKLTGTIIKKVTDKILSNKMQQKAKTKITMTTKTVLQN